MEMKRVLITGGSGQMGSGIAQVMAECGLDVILWVRNMDRFNKSIASIEKILNRGVEKGKITVEHKETTLKRISGVTDIDTKTCDVDLVIEAVVEDIETKINIFKTLDNLCPSHTIFSSNTSSISITALASKTSRPEKFIGMHFFNPAPVMKLVEVVTGLATSKETCATIMELAEKLGKIPVKVSDYPGFVGNRVMIPMINEAVFVLEQGVACAKDVDNVAKTGFNHPIGPLALADLIGLDTVLAIMEILHKELGEDKYRPCPLLHTYVNAGWLGVKSGRGFYNYKEGA